MGHDAVFDCPGELARRCAVFDWSSTPLGPVADWSPALRTTTATVLRSRFPMCLSWGPDLVLLYNDAFVATLGSKHPAALGARIQDVFAEIWDEVGHLQWSVLAGGEATYAEEQAFVLEMAGGPEETFYTFGYSHVPEDPPGERGPGGVLATVANTTRAVVGARRMTLLNDLANATREAADRDAAAATTIGVLDRARRDLRRGALYLPDGDGALTLAGAFGVEHAWATSRAPDEPAVPDVVALPIRSGCGGGLLAVEPHPLRPLDDEHGRFLHLLAEHVGQVLSLATTRSEDQQRLASLAAADRAKSTFLSQVSHELRTPLTLLLVPLDDALDAGSTIAADELSAIHHSAHRLLRMVNGLLEVTRVDAGPRAPAPEPTDVARITEDLVRPFAGVTARAGLELRTTLDASVGVVELDPELWETVLTNLVANAVKYTVAGHVEVALEAVAGALELRVTDTGIGIPAAEHDQVFKRFHRVAGPVGRTIEGTGLGLTLVADAVDALGGTIALDSAPDVGSTFVVRVPLVPSPAGRPRATAADVRAAAALAADVAPATPAAPPVPEQVAADDPRPAVLVVDDNSGMRALLGRVLAGLGPVVACADGREALDVLRSRSVGLVVTDVMMPRLDGVGLVRELRADPTVGQVPVVVVSARAESGAVTEALAAGADDYVVKPFTRDELLARCRVTMELAALRVSRAATSARTSMVAGISHDMQTPLSVVTGALEVLGDVGLDDDERRSLLARAGGRARQLERLVSELLDWSRLATGKRIEGRREPVGVVELVTTAAGRHPATDVVPADGAEVVVRVDRVRTERILDNLLDNAHDAARSQVRVEIDADDADVRVRVVDDGPGIAPLVAADLFEPTGPAVSRGVALGLHVSREAARAQGGDVVLSSTGPTGTRFELVLPREHAPGG